MKCLTFKYILIAIVTFLFISGVVYGDDKKENSNKSLKDFFAVNLDLFHSDEKNDINPKFEISLKPQEWKGNEHELAVGSISLLADLEGKFVQTWDEELNIEPSFIKGSVGFLWNISDVEEEDHPPSDPDDLITGNNNESEKAFKYNFGGVKFRAHAWIESDEDADNVNLVGGVELVYSSFGAFNDNKIQPPSFGIGYQYVEPTETEARESLGADTSSFPRLSAFVLWNWDFGEALFKNNAFSKNLALQAHYRYFKEYDQSLAWKAAGYDEYDQTVIKLRYHLPAQQRNTYGFREVYVGFSSGRQIAHAYDDNRILLGILIQ